MKKMQMRTPTSLNRRNTLIASAALLITGLVQAAPPADADAKRRELDAAADGATTELYATAASSKEMVAKAQGVLIFPKVVSAGFVVGGSYGEGVLRKGGKTTGYYSVGAASVGLLAGAQTKAMYVLFMTPEALAKFEASKGWTAGADASIVVLEAGAAARADTKTAQAPIVGYVHTKAGLMANLSLDGTKFSRLDL